MILSFIFTGPHPQRYQNKSRLYLGCNQCYSVAFVGGPVQRLYYFMTPALEMGTGTEQDLWVVWSAVTCWLPSIMHFPCSDWILSCVPAPGHHSGLAINVGLLSAKFLCVISFVLSCYPGCEHITLSQRHPFHLARRFITSILL